MVGVGVTSGVGNSASLVGSGSVGMISVVGVAGTAVGGSSVAISVGGSWETAVFVGSGVGDPPQADSQSKLKLTSTNKTNRFFTLIFLYKTLRKLLATTNAQRQAQIISDRQPMKQRPAPDLGNLS
jgi:hypothetical protein